MAHCFVTGIGTDVGKTIAAAVLTYYHKADYWKPVQTGDVKDYTFIQEFGYGNIQPSIYDLPLPASPHLAAQQAGVIIDTDRLVLPKVSSLVVEGAGGLLVPLNQEHYIGHLTAKVDKVYLVVKHYLGSINHTLLSLHWLKQQGISPEIIVSGEPNKSSEQAIEQFTGQAIQKYIPQLSEFSKEVFLNVANSWR